MPHYGQEKTEAYIWRGEGGKESWIDSQMYTGGRARYGNLYLFLM